MSSRLSYAHGTSEVPLVGATIGGYFDRVLARHPEREAVVVAHQDVRWTYSEFAERIDSLARGLVGLGLAPGDRMGIWAPNCAEWLLVQYASAKAGVILVNVNPAYRTSELQYALRQSGCRLLVAARAFKTSNYEQMVAEVSPLCEQLERTVFLDTPEWEALATGSGSGELPGGLQFDDAINIQYTSGTTGFPKGATLTHHNLLNNAFFVAEKLGYTCEDRVCVPVPFYHCFGMVLGNLAAMTRGATVVVPAAAFEPAAVLEAVQRERCTSLYGVPTMFIAELELPEFGEFDLTSLRTGVMAGSPCPVEVMRRVIERMHMSEVQIAYGMTETSPVSTQSDATDDVEHRTSTVGRVHPHVEIKIVDPATGECVPRGTPGELCTRGYSVMLGYWNDAEQTAAAIDSAGWMHTGDLATMDGDGYVNIVGRSKDMVIRGGENVYPREVEEFLYGHPEVRDVQVVGVPDERYGEELVAFVIPRDASRFEGEALRDYCRGQISHYKVPRYVIAVEDFPMTVTGKIQKFKLREMAIEQLGLESAITATA